MDAKIKKRLWIRNFIIIFLIILLLLTFFSNTIMNYTLPEVSVKYPTYSTITSKITGYGTVTANQSVQVTLQETRVIDKIMVSRGQKVYRGDVLFTLTQNDSAELSDARDALRTLEFELISLKSQELSDTSSVKDQIAAKQAEIDQIKKTIATKETALDKLNELNKTISTLEANNALQNTTIENCNKEVVKQENLRQEAMNGYSVPYSVLYEGIDGATKLKADSIVKVSSQEAVITSLNKDRADLVALKNEQKEKVTSKEKDIARLEETLSTYDTFMNVSESYKIRYDIELIEEEHNALTAYNNALKEYTTLLQTTLNPYSAEALKAQEKVSETKAKYESYTGGYYYSDEYYNALLNIKTQQLANSFEYGISVTYESYKELRVEYEKVKRQINTAKLVLASYNEDIAATDESIAKLDEKILEEKNTLAEYNNDVKKADAYIAYFTFQENIDKQQITIKKCEAAIADNSKLLNNCNESKNALTEILAIKDSDLQSQLATSQKELDSLNLALERRILEVQLEEERHAYDIEKLEAKIDKQKAQITKLEDAQLSTEVLANATGTVDSIYVISGEQVSVGSALCDISLAEKGYTMSFSVTNEQSSRIKVGDIADIEYYWYGETPVATVVAIKSDPSSKGQSKIVTLSVTGEDLYNGQNISFTLGSSNKGYSNVVPNNAVREDNNGTFILMVEAKQTPLGNRYIAKRVDVKVVASDETNSALSSSQDLWDYVITTSSLPVTEGMQVRLADKDK